MDASSVTRSSIGVLQDLMASREERIPLCLLKKHIAATA